MIEVTMVSLKCSRCGKDFQRKPYRVKIGKLPFCSHSCQVRYGVEKKSKETKTLCTCTNCGNAFETSTRGLKRRNKKYGIFCSKKCYYSYIRGGDFSSYVSLTCSVCGKEFQRKSSIEKSSRKRFTKICCSRACASKIEHGSDDDLKSRLFYQLSQVIRQGTHEVGEDVDGDYLLSVWRAQKGKCPYTGKDLLLKKHRKRGDRVPNQASIDRIDSKKGYIRGNIEFISLMANYAKNIWTRNDVISFCSEVVQNAKR